MKLLSFAQFAFYLDGAVVQFDDAFGQSQTDTGTYAGGETVHLLCLIEAVEYLIYFFGVDAAACISHANYGFIAFGGELSVMVSSAWVCLMALDNRLLITFCICFWSYHTSRPSLSFSKLKLICLLLAYSMKMR